MTISATVHRWALHAQVEDYLRLGWLALPSLEGTSHGQWSAHLVWLCECKPTEPVEAAKFDAAGPVA